MTLQEKTYLKETDVAAGRETCGVYFKWCMLKCGCSESDCTSFGLFSFPSSSSSAPPLSRCCGYGRGSEGGGWREGSELRQRFMTLWCACMWNDHPLCIGMRMYDESAPLLICVTMLSSNLRLFGIFVCSHHHCLRHLTDHSSCV